LEELACHLPLLSHALALARKRHWNSLEFRDVTPWLPPETSAPSVEFFHHTIDLADGEEAALARCDSSVRRSVRKAQGAGLQVVEANDIPAVQAYFQLHSLTRQRHGLPPQPYDFFLKLHQHLLSPGLGSILLVLLNQVPIAGAVFLFWRRRALYKFGASDLQHQALRPNNLLFRDALRLCLRRQCSTLDLGRTSLEHDGLRRFKLGWGGHERRLAYLRYHVPSHQVILTPDRTSGWHVALFRLLPRPLASLVGRIGYRFAA
jgi:lipid II:glycine glycyltransferase (peptidoglycan interpeptide bridge formation enzyme)